MFRRFNSTIRSTDIPGATSNAPISTLRAAASFPCRINSIPLAFAACFRSRRLILVGPLAGEETPSNTTTGVMPLLESNEIMRMG